MYIVWKRLGHTETSVKGVYVIEKCCANIVSGKTNSDIVRWLAELEKKRRQKRASGGNEKGGKWEDGVEEWV